MAIFIIRIFLIIISFAVICQTSFSQQLNREIDSLMNVLKTSVEDTNKVNNLNTLSSRLWGAGNFTDSRKYADEALVLAGRLEFKKGIAAAYFNIGYNYAAQRENYSEAMKNYTASLKTDEEIGNKMGIAGTYISIGLIQARWGNYPEALHYFFTSLKIYEEIKCMKGVADSYNKIGTIFRYQGNYAEALEKYISALRIMEEVGDKGNIADSYNYLGMIYWYQGNYSEALKKYLAALKLREEVGIRAAVAGSYNNIGELYRSLGNYPEALKNQMVALKIVEEIQNKYGISLYLKDIGKVYIQLGKNSEAKKYLISALSLSKEIGDIENIGDACKYLSKIDSAMGNFQQALVDYKLYTDYKDSLFNEKSSNQMALMKEQYESEKKDKEIEILNKENAIQQLQLKKQKQTKNYFIAGLVLFVVLSFLIYRNYHAKQKLKLLTLRNKIASDLHDDIGSTLSSISIFSQMALEQSNEVKPMLQTIGDSSRKMLDAMADIVWNIQPENDQFEKIILRMRSFAYELLGAKQIDFRFVADNNFSNIKLPMEARRNLYLIFKEATNNMVKYAEARKAMFSIKGEKDKLVMMIKDDGKGFDSNKETQGNGLKNMKKRAGEMGADLMIDSIPGRGTTIKLELAV